MRVIRPHLWFVTFAVVVGLGGALASAQQKDEPTVAELKARIDALQRQVELLQAKQQQGPGDASTKAEVIADAEKRSQAPVTGGYSDGKFTLRAPDETFSLSPGGRPASAGPPGARPARRR